MAWRRGRTCSFVNENYFPAISCNYPPALGLAVEYDSNRLLVWHHCSPSSSFPPWQHLSSEHENSRWAPSSRDDVWALLLSYSVSRWFTTEPEKHHFFSWTPGQDSPCSRCSFTALLRQQKLIQTWVHRRNGASLSEDVTRPWLGHGPEQLLRDPKQDWHKESGRHKSMFEKLSKCMTE